MALERAQHRKRHKLINHQFRAQQVPDRSRVLPRDSQDPGGGRQNPAECGLKVEVRVDVAEDAVQQSDQGDERNQHGADIEGEKQPVRHASGNRV